MLEAKEARCAMEMIANLSKEDVKGMVRGNILRIVQ